MFGKREARIVRVDGFRLEAVPEGHIILCENDDSPGVVGNIGTSLGTAGVNIARHLALPPRGPLPRPSPS